MCRINWLVPFIWLESCTPTHSVQSWVFSWLPLRSETWGKRVLVLCTCHYWSTVVLLTEMIYIIKWTNVETFEYYLVLITMLLLLMIYDINHIWTAEMKWKWRGHEVTGSNPVEILNFFQASLRNCINCVHCDDHFFIFNVTINVIM